MSLHKADKKSEESKAYYQEAVSCIKKQDFVNAEKNLLASINRHPSADAYHNLGVLRFMQGKAEEALQHLHSAVMIDPAYDESYATGMRIMRQQGNIPRAIEYCAMAIKAAPAKSAHKAEFISLIGNMKFMAFSPDIKQLIAICMESGDQDIERLQNAWMSLYRLDPLHAPLVNLAKQEDFKAFEKAFGKCRDTSPLNDRFFTLGLKNMGFSDLTFERFLTHLRHILLKDFSANGTKKFGPEYLPFVAALATYCFYTEFIFHCGEEENAWLNDLQAKVESSPNLSEELYALCLLGCYRPLHKHPKAQDFLEACEKRPELKNFTLYVLRQPLTEQDLRKSIPPITDIQAGTSSEVQQQYEEFPYPRWRILLNVKKPEALAQFKETDDLKILIAGAGTGKEALVYAKLFPKADILAIDLSLTSLSYARRIAIENNLSNVTFRQADILLLGSVLKCEYDIIVSCGVLHHLKEPEAGLGILVSLLKPGGIMHLAFYSEIARQGFVAAQKIIKEKNYGHDAQAIRKFRADMHRLLKKIDYESIIYSHDYYFTSECRDLLFHVMEHRLTIPQLSQMLDRVNLEFLGFSDLGGNMMQIYDRNFPGDPGRSNLENWDKLERQYPAMFRKMYQFWAKKP